MASYDYDVIVIGSGAGGNIAAQQLAKAGKSVALIEKGKLGGPTPRYGSIPFQAVRQSAEIFQAAKHGARFGVRGVNVGYNYPSIKAWKDLVVKRTRVQNSEEHLLGLSINVVQGRAHFIDPHTVSIGNTRFSSREFLIATGSELTIPDAPGLPESGFITAREALDLNRPPKSLAIVGSDSSACEFAELFASFGTKVYLIDSAPSLLSEEEPDVADILSEHFMVDLSMTLVFDASLEAVRKVGTSKRVSFNRAGKSQTILVDEILITSPKKASLDIGLENAGVQHKDGGIIVDQTLQTSAKHIYAAGSCTGQSGAGTHVSTYQSQIAAYNLCHQKPLYADYRAVPRVIFTSPEVAIVGPTERELKRQNINANTATAPLSVIAKANTTDFSDGFVKLNADKRTGALLGGTIMCPSASELVQELSLAVQNHLDVSQIAQTVHAFPTWSEAIRVAAAKLAKS